MSLFFWSDTSPSWGARASVIDPPPLTNDLLDTWTANGISNTWLGTAVTDPGDPAPAFGSIFTETNIITREGNRTLYQAVVGYATANGSGEISVYIDDRSNAAGQEQRTWLDGVGYRVGTALIPEFTQQPQGLSIILGDGGLLRASAISTLPISYQWQLDGTNIVGATNRVYDLGAVASTSAQGDYTMVATTSSGSATSDVATVSIVGPALSPAIQLVPEGFGASIAIQSLPLGTTNYTYQWYLGTSVIASATNSSYSIGSATTNDTGTYTVDVTIGGDTVISDPALLTVLASPTTSYFATVVADSPVAYWRLGESTSDVTAVDSVGSEDLSINAGVVMEATGALLGDADTAANFTGANDSFCEGAGYSPALNTAQFSVEFWGRQQGGSGERIAVGSRDRDPVQTNEVYGYEIGIDANDNWMFRTGDGLISTTVVWNTLTGPAAEIVQYTHVVATFDGTDMSLFVNGLPGGVLTNVNYSPNTFFEIRVGAGANEDAAPLDLLEWVGDLDEVVYFNFALSESQVQTHYGALFQSASAPVITEQPADISVSLGDTGILSVGIHPGTPVDGYQWKREGVIVPGATNSTLEIVSVGTGDGGQYTVVASNSFGSVESESAWLVPLINPLGTFFFPTTNNTIRTSDGTNQWYAGGYGVPAQDLWRNRTVFAIIGLPESVWAYESHYDQGFLPGDNLELQTTIDGLTPGIDYAVWTLWGHKNIQDNGSSSEPSILAEFVTPAPDPQAPLRLFDEDNSLDTGEISVSPTDPWTVFHGYIGVQTADLNGEIKVLVDYTPECERTVYHGLGYQVANPVPAPPVITIQPQDTGAPLGDTNTTLSVVAGSVLPQTYQWTHNGMPIPTGTNATLAFSAITQNDAGTYQVSISNSEGTTVSVEVELVVIDDFFENFVFPDDSNTVLTRDEGMHWSTNDLVQAESNGIWHADPDFAIDGISSNGFFANGGNPSRELRTTLSGLSPGQEYGVWGLYSFPIGSQGHRINMGLEGEVLTTYDDSHMNTGMTNGVGDTFTVFAGFLRAVPANGAGEIDIYVDFNGLAESVYNGIAYQAIVAPIPLDIDLIGGLPTVSWSTSNTNAVLQSSEDLTNPSAWTNEAGATSPHTDSGGASIKSFRLAE